MKTQSETDKIWIAQSLDSGAKYGFPQCCIDEFVALPPGKMTGKPTKEMILRFDMAKIAGKFTGFVPCIKHAKEIKDRKIKLEDLIDYKTRLDIVRFPGGWSFK